MSREKRKKLSRKLKKDEKIRERKNNISKEGAELKMNENDLNRVEQDEEKKEKKGLFAFLGRHKFGTSVSALALAAAITFGVVQSNKNDSKIKDVEAPKPSASDTIKPKPETPVDTEPEQKEMVTPSVSYSTTELTNEDVTVSILAEEDIQPLSGWELSDNEKELTRTFGENVDMPVTVTSKSGVSKTVQVTITNIDKKIISPKVIYSTTNPTTGNVTVTIKLDEEMQALQGWKLSEDKKSMTKVYTQNEETTITVKDLAGNSINVNVSVTNIDRVFNKLNVRYSTETLTNGDVEVTIISDEEMQELEGWKLSADKKSMTRVYTQNEKTTLTVKDLAGNSQELTINITNIDKNFNKPEVSYSTRKLTNGDVEVTIISDEAMQELEGWKLSEDKKSMTKVYSSNKIETITVKDLAGNQEKLLIIIANIDKTFDKAEVNYKNLSNGNVLVTITSNEKLQKIDGWELSEDEKSLMKIYTANKEEKVTIRDLAGNTQIVKIKVTGVRDYSSDSSYDNNHGNGGNGGNPGDKDPSNPGDKDPSNPGDKDPNNPSGDKDNNDKDNQDKDNDRENQDKDDKDNNGIGGGKEDQDNDIDLGQNPSTSTPPAQQQPPVQTPPAQQQPPVQTPPAQQPPAADPDERENENSDGKENQGLGAGAENDDDDIVLVNQLREMKRYLEIIKINGVEFEYTTEREVISEEVYVFDSHTLMLKK